MTGIWRTQTEVSGVYEPLQRGSSHERGAGVLSNLSPAVPFGTLLCLPNAEERWEDEKQWEASVEALSISFQPSLPHCPAAATDRLQGWRRNSKLLRLHLLLKLSCRGEKLTGQMEGSLRLEIIWEAVCLTDRPDLQAKTYSTAPILTRELPNGINIVSKYNLVSI